MREEAAMSRFIQDPNHRGSRVRPPRAAGLPFFHCANARAVACRLSLPGVKEDKKNDTIHSN